jgi:hypothetical protein
MTDAITRWRTRRAIVEARRFDPGADYDAACEVVNWCTGRATDFGCELLTPDGILYAAPGDWIVKLEGGEFFPLTPGIFDAMLTQYFPSFIPKDHVEALCLDEDAGWEEVATRIGGSLRNREIADTGEYETILEIPAGGTAVPVTGSGLPLQTWRGIVAIRDAEISRLREQLESAQARLAGRQDAP